MALSLSTDFRVSLFVYYLFAVTFCLSTSLERQLAAYVNPGCPSPRCNDSKVEVVHVQADGPNDTLHYVWCFQSKPTVLVARTPPGSKLFVSWEDFPNASSSIYFSPPPYYSFGVLINQVYEFNDVNDTGSLDMDNCNESYIRRIDMPDSWELSQPFQKNRDSVRLVMDGFWKKQPSFIKNGNMRVELETFRNEDHGPKLPHLLHSANATQIEVSFLNVFTESGFQQSRFAIELMMAANESVGGIMDNRSTISLDDEHTPGVFTVIDLQTPASKQNGDGGYLQWHPVSYVAEERDIVNSTETAFYPVKYANGSLSECEGTLFTAFFGTDLTTSLLNAVNISFGAKDDGFYSRNNVSIWAVNMGYGHPPDDKFSLLIIVIMGVCLGLPAVLIVLSGFYVALRRISYRKDDLLLSE